LHSREPVGRALQYNPWRKPVISTYERLVLCNFFETAENAFQSTFSAAGWLNAE
jgi:hypothetical protein